jgi:hypothetical protein
MTDLLNNRVFVSYSHKDSRWLHMLQTAFDPMTRNSTIDLWSDTRIHPGKPWRAELESSLADSKAALLLVTPDFLASSFIMENELPPLLTKARNDGLVVLWVAVSASLYAETEIGNFQCVNDPLKPLDSLPRPKLRQELVRIAGALKRTLAESQRTPFLTQSKAHLDLPVSIELSHVATASLAILKISQSKLVNLIKAELVSHKILTRIDYECIPRPLISGLFVFLTKRGSHLTVESVGAHVVEHQKVELWSQLCQSYLEAYRLPFRSDHRVLIQETEFRRTLKTMENLLESLTKYIYQTKLYHDAKAYPNLHKLKRIAETNYVAAEDLYSKYQNSSGDDALLGQVALALDLITSSVHKVAVEYGVRS